MIEAIKREFNLSYRGRNMLLNILFFFMTNILATDNCPTYYPAESRCTACSTTGPRHQRPGSCQYRKTASRCVLGGSSNPYTLTTLPDTIVVYLNGDCHNSTGSPESITDLPHTFNSVIKNQATGNSYVTSIPADLIILGHFCQHDIEIVRDTCGD